MAKKVIISESMAKRLVSEGIIVESGIDDIIKNRDFKKEVKDITVDIVKKDKDIEKEIKKIVAKSVENLFKTLWQRSQTWTNNI